MADDTSPLRNDGPDVSSDLRRALVISHVGDTKHKDGGTVYTRSLLEILKSSYPGVEIDVLFFTGQASALTKRLRQVRSLVQSSFSALPSKALYFRSRAFAKNLVSAMAYRHYDLVILDHAEMLWCLDVIPPNTPVLAVAHNIEGKIYEEFLRDWPVSRMLFSRDLLKYQRYEEDGLARARNVIAISTEDTEELCATIPGLDVLVVPPTFSYAPVKRSGELHEPLRVAMLGNFDWWPNREGYGWFLEQVWRHVAENRELHLFGRHSKSLPTGPRTISHGYVDRLSEVWHTVDLMVNPIVSGSGVNVKVAEAIHNGMPMVCTSKAVAGLLAEPDPAIAVLDRAEDWIRLLSGDDAALLAQKAPSTAARERVAAGTHTKPMADFVGKILRPGKANNEFPGRNRRTHQEIEVG